MADESKRVALHVGELETRNLMLANSNHTLSQNYKRIYQDYQICKSITNEVERLLGKQITQQNVLNAREELSTIVVVNGDLQHDQDRLTRIVNSIFREKHAAQRRTFSP